VIQAGAPAPAGDDATVEQHEDKAVPLPRTLRSLLAGPFAADRMDTWVLTVSVAIPLVCLAGLALWHLAAYLARKLPKKPRPVRHSPEPPAPSPSPKFLARERGPAEVAPTRGDPERLQQACTALEDSLGEKYLELAEGWLRQGQPQKAAAALKRVLQICPEKLQAQLAQDRLRQMGNQVGDQHP
jgi:hypothetical protein